MIEQGRPVLCASSRIGGIFPAPESPRAGLEEFPLHPHFREPRSSTDAPKVNVLSADHKMNLPERLALHDSRIAQF